MKPEFTKYGPKHDYRGAHVVLKYGERFATGPTVNRYQAALEKARDVLRSLGEPLEGGR